VFKIFFLFLFPLNFFNDQNYFLLFLFLLLQGIEAAALYVLNKDSRKTTTPTTPTNISMIEKLLFIL